jgi:hypothetical protein
MKDREHPIESQLAEERAATLGLAGRRVEAALAALAPRGRESGADLIDDAATAVWYYLITRESLRMFDHQAALAIYKVPPYVLARVGVVRRA